MLHKTGMVGEITVIIPTLNEEGYLPSCLNAMHVARAHVDGGVEILVVDGGSHDRTVACARAAGAACRDVSPAGRARQMNAGAAAARGDILVFVHADTLLPPDGLAVLASAASDGTTLAALTLAIDSPRYVYRVIEWGARLRSRYMQLPYGDQCLALSAGLFRKLGGYREDTRCEDLDLVLRARSRCRIRTLAPPATTSERRWREAGVVSTTGRNWRLLGTYLARRRG